MTEGGAADGLRPIFATWARYNEEIVRVVAALSPEQLEIRASPDSMPVWATIGHLAGARIYWLCGILGEPGAATTPFADPFADGWEDDETHARTAEELVEALESTWRVVDGCLGRWSVGMLAERFVRDMPTGRQHHSRGQLLLRLLTHDAYHAGELSQVLGIHRLPQIDLWHADAVEPPPDGQASVTPAG
jgi:uncharacterized damage-inducible protein DinB